MIDCSLFLVACGLISPILVQISFPSPPLLAQTNPQYDQLMKLGYRATVKRDYQNALIYFRRAEHLRPSDRYATMAIRNISLYVRRGQVKVPLFIASGSGAPINRVAAATRGSRSCLGKDACLTALLPETDPELLMTAADYPILLFYIPQTSAQVMEVRVLDQDQIYQASFNLPQTAGFVGVTVASLKNAKGENLPPLKIDQQYQWDCTLIVDVDDPSGNVTVNGKITRASLNPELAEILKQAPLGDRLSLYAANNLWYDLIASLYLERKADPNNRGLVEEWNAILETIKLKDYALSPLL